MVLRSIDARVPPSSSAPCRLIILTFASGTSADEFGRSSPADHILHNAPRSCGRLPGNAELPAQRSHALTVLEPDHKPHSLIRHRTFSPWHVLHPVSLQAEWGYPRLRNVL